MKRSLSSFKLLDIALILAVIGAASISGYYIYGNRGGRVHLVIEAPSGSWVYGLDTDRTIDIPGPLGNTVVEIAKGEAKIIDSPCPNKTCISSPPVSKKGQWNACLPNQVIIRVDGDAGAADEIDAVVN